MKYNKERVLTFLPHRDPFLFVDSVEKIYSKKVKNDEKIMFKDLSGAKVLAHYYTDPDHVIFKGHFPNYPILPGVVQVEMMAQVSSFILDLVVDDPENISMDVALVSIDKAKFRKPIHPGMNLVIETECTRSRNPMLANNCRILCDGELMSEVSVLASVKI